MAKDTDYSIFVDPSSKKKLKYSSGKLKGSSGTFSVKQDIPDLIFPRELPSEDLHAQKFYDGRAQQYDDTLHLTFFTHGEDEIKTRNRFIDKLNIKSSGKVLEVACGTGRDSELIAKRLSGKGELHLQDISRDMMQRCYNKLKKLKIKKSFALSNACYLPYPDQYFDAVYSFGAMGEFSDQKKALAEMVRVTKPGGKIVVGDESVPVWHRNTDFYKTLLVTNPMFAAEVPFDAIPVEARKVNIEWVIGGTFYLLDFVVGEGEPTANFDYDIPGVRGGTYRTRYEGQLEGVKPETKKLAYEAARKKKVSMHDWLDKLVKEAAKKELKGK
ncbi:MAG TPA: methyltransferase domain-containing protein [Bacteroidia bacterium]|nr:methyltransferase domain-containing protein [Bacteroidia bacterium]